jgi:YVTN family beta-propeller protein
VHVARLKRDLIAETETGLQRQQDPIVPSWEVLACDHHEVYRFFACQRLDPTSFPRRHRDGNAMTSRAQLPLAAAWMRLEAQTTAYDMPQLYPVASVLDNLRHERIVVHSAEPAICLSRGSPTERVPVLTRFSQGAEKGDLMQSTKHWLPASVVCVLSLTVTCLLAVPAHGQPLAYVTNSGSESVSVTASNTVIATVAVEGRPIGVAFSPDGSRVYVANSASDSVSVMETANNTVIATVPDASFPQGVAVTPDGSRV